ncbi:MAG: PLDc N-terminal domain-containing protein [Phycisphaerales bacterium]
MYYGGGLIGLIILILDIIAIVEILQSGRAVAEKLLWILLILLLPLVGVLIYFLIGRK